MEMTCQLRLILKMSNNGPTLCVPFFNFMVSSTVCESSGHRRRLFGICKGDGESEMILPPDGWSSPRDHRVSC